MMAASVPSGGVGGSASPVSRSAFLDLAVKQQPNQVDLVIAVKGAPPVTPPTDPGTPPVAPPAVFQSVAATPNQFSTALALNTLPQAGGTLALYNSLLMLDAPSARAAFDQLSGEVHASAKMALGRGELTPARGDERPAALGLRRGRRRADGGDELRLQRRSGTELVSAGCGIADSRASSSPDI
jgi:hypothetical protein